MADAEAAEGFACLAAPLLAFEAIWIALIIEAAAVRCTCEHVTRCRPELFDVRAECAHALALRCERRVHLLLRRLVTLRKKEDALLAVRTFVRQELVHVL